MIQTSVDIVQRFAPECPELVYCTEDVQSNTVIYYYYEGVRTLM